MEQHKHDDETRTAIRKAEDRREYLRRYYRRNRERAREYQREYNARYRKKAAAGASSRQDRRLVFTPSDIMSFPTEKAGRLVNDILRGKKSLVM